MQFRQTQLDNGLDIIAEVSPQATSLAAGFFVRTGSRDETPEVAGVSHFLEHMVFKGTPRRSALDVNLQFDRLGAMYNAFTSEENTVYFAAVLPEFQRDLLELLCDILRPSLRGDDFDTEKGVIQEEIAMYLDRPQFTLYEQLMARHFDSHPLGNLILGTTESIGALKRDDMQAYFDRRYSPTNLTLVGVGNLDFDAFLDQARTACGDWTPFTAERDTQPSAGSRVREVLHDAKLARQNLGWMAPAPSCQDEDRFAAQLLATILGDSSGSRLYYALIETGLADEAHTAYSPMDGAGGMMTFVSTSPDQAQRVMDIVRDEFAAFAKDGPTEGELEAAKNKIASSATVKSELPMGRLTAVGFDWVYRKEYQPLPAQIETLFAVTRDDVHRLAQDCELTRPTTLALGPMESLPT
jgi:predicted Zn-dependent peptidase